MSLQPSGSVSPVTAPGGIDNLTCQWQGCAQPNHASPEKLYEHVCETHIGRKSTNNLNLQCYWGTCRTTTVKRDHITSHIRVHVPLKPHKCDFCGKSFKRPQDLKKHVKTHADESVLLNSPQAGAGRTQTNGYHVQANGKSAGFYGDGGLGSHMNYASGYANMQGSYNQFGAGAPQVGMHGHGYGGPHYGVPQMSSYGGLTESRKRTHDALNDFFGDIKRRNLDANQYQDLNARFGNYLNSMMGQSGFQNGFNQGYGGGMDAGGGLAFQTAQPVPMVYPGYNAPFSEVKTKHDLLSIDQFLEQLQQTVYETPATDITNMMPMNTNMYQGGVTAAAERGSHSPPRLHAGTPSQATTEDTPALTPSSFQASHSPSSSHQSIPPSSGAGVVGYPSLPPFSALQHNETNQFAQGPSGGAPPSGLGSRYEDLDNRSRRFSGGRLQRHAPSPSSPEEAEKPASPKSSEMEEGSPKAKEEPVSPQQPGLKLPGVAQITGKSEEGSEKSDRSEREGSPRTQNLRIIQQLRHWVNARLDRGEFQSEDDESGKETPRAHGSDTEMADADADDGSSGHGSTPKRTGPAIAYPNLAMEA